MMSTDAIPQDSLSRLINSQSTDSVDVDNADGIDQYPNDPLSGQQWYLGSESPAAINLYDAWQVTHGSAEIVVAVIDTGVRFEHPDIAGRLLPGYDFVSSTIHSNDGDGRDGDASDPGNRVDQTFTEQLQPQHLHCKPTDSTWHGTAITSVIAANSMDGYGMAGVDRHAQVLPVRVAGRCGGTRSDMLDAIRWAAGVGEQHLPANPTPARIINISLAIDGGCTAEDQRAIDDAISAGAIVVAGVGNDQRHLDSHPTSPATCDGVVSVAAVTADGQLTDYSNFGSAVDLVAPGGDVLDNTQFPIVTASNEGTDYAMPVSNHRSYSGTSVATPLVSGVLSLMWSIDPDLSNTELVNLITASAKPSSRDADCGGDECGAGILDASRAVRNTLSYVDNTLPVELAAAIAAPDRANLAGGSGAIAPAGLLLITLVINRRRRRMRTNTRPVDEFAISNHHP